MGAETSYTHPYMVDPYVTISDTPCDSQNDEGSCQMMKMQQINQTGFSGTWSMKFPECLTPAARSGHLTVHDKENNQVIIGYGIDQKNNFLNDFWILDLKTFLWTRINIDKQQVASKNGATGVLIDKKIFVFGGFRELVYESDFHIVDLDSLQITRPQFDIQPSGRVGHVFAYHNGKILLWGGYNGDWLNDLWILDIATMTWREINADIKGRTAAAFTTHSHYVYIFGASKTDALLRFDFDTETFEVLKSSGSSPTSTLGSASLIGVDNYLLLFGGNADKSKFSLLYCYHIERQTWFVFHIIPDGQSTNITDGKINKNGNFMVPRLSACSCIYHDRLRTVVVFLGAPLAEPPAFYTIEIGDALSYLHYQADLQEMLDMSIAISNEQNQN